MTDGAPPAGDGMSRRARRVLIGLGVTAAVSFAVFLALVVFDVGRMPSSGADVDSRSAVGHRPLLDVLEALDVPHAVLRWLPLRLAGADALLVVLEPTVDALEAQPQQGRDGLEALRRRRGPVLLVLPKWSPVPDPARPGHVREARLRDLRDVQRVLDAAGLPATAVRTGPGTGWSVGVVGATPSLASPSQWIAAGPRIRPIVFCDQGVLLAAVDDGRPEPLHVLSDPDVLATHGLFRGENAMFTVGWLDRLRPPGGTVLVDAASQGRSRPPSLARELFGWPLSLATLTALVAVGLAVACGAVRFGAPRPEASPFEGRTLPVVEHAADLALHGGHAVEALERYLSGSVAAVARAVHAPPALEPRDLHAWIDRAAAARGVPHRVEALEAAVASARSAPGTVLRVAARVHEWRASFAHGTRHGP